VEVGPSGKAIDSVGGQHHQFSPTQSLLRGGQRGVAHGSRDVENIHPARGYPSGSHRPFVSYPRPRITVMEVSAPARLHSPVDMLDHATGVMAAASAEALRAVAACNEMRLWRRDGATSMTSWLAARYGLAWGTAREWVRVAHALRELPRIAEAYARGRLSWDQLRPLTRFATRKTDELWAERGPGLRPAGLWREARRHERALVREAQEIHRERYLRLNWDHLRPVLWLEGMLPAEEGAALESALCSEGR
jgi:hypothetical protein